MSKTSLSIVIPTYNRCQSTANLVKIIIPQMYDCDELIVVDDGSNDRTAEAISSFSGVNLITKSINEGMVSNWNTCLRAASKNWICIVHDDDILSADALSTIRRSCNLVDQPALIGNVSFEKSSKETFRCQIAEPSTWAVLNSAVIPSGTTIHRTIVEDLGVFDERFPYSSDIEYFARICKKYILVRVENPSIVSFVLHERNYEYKTWLQPDFLDQLEKIERCVLNYSRLPEPLHEEQFNLMMNNAITHMLNSSSLSEEVTLLSQVASLVCSRSYLNKRNRVKASIASVLNWCPGI